VAQPSVLQQVYCTDEDLAVRALGDYPTLCPEWQKLAYGTDGVLAAGSPWVLSSASNAFASLGVGSNNVVQLTAPKSSFKGAGELFAVDSALGNTITLRRLNQALNAGLPPGGGIGLTGVEFKVKTFYAQIDNACFDANRFFGIDPNNATNTPAALYDTRELRQFCVLTVLQRLYAEQVRTDTGDFKLKLAQVSADLKELKASLTIRWGDMGESQLGRGIFGGRVRR
jgi:hypothetical protein